MTQNAADLGLALVPRDLLGLPNDYVAPSTQLETRLTEAFSRCLHVTPVGLDDDFYDLGGDSLQGEQISIAVEEILGRTFQISSLFYIGTPRKIAASVAHAEITAMPTVKPILFIVHGRGGYTMPRKEFLIGLNDFCTIEMFEMPGIRGNGVPPKSLQAIAKSYCDRIEALQPVGEIILASFCVGGLIALDMIRQLNDRGRKLHGVVLVDPNVSSAIRDVYTKYQTANNPKARIEARIYAFLVTGRWSETVPFLQGFYRWLYMHLMMAKKYFRPSATARNSTQTLDRKAQAWLFASYRFVTLLPINNPITIIASQDRMAQFTNPSGFWKYIAPQSDAIEVARTHQDVFQVESQRTVDLIKQRLFFA